MFWQEYVVALGKAFYMATLLGDTDTYLEEENWVTGISLITYYISRFYQNT